ncbi:MAG: hypothetical protein JWO13_3279 [Acidobacteriales bacterium]|nr:hypothetical protein [Terriglobales bacterium]
MGIWDSRTARALFTALVFAAILGIAFVSRKVIFLFVFVVLFAYLMEPIVSRVQRWFRGSRWKAVAATYIVFWAIVGGFLFTAGQRAVQEGQNAAQQLPELNKKLQSGDIASDIGNRVGFKEQTSAQLKQVLQKNRQRITDFSGAILRRVPAYLSNAGWMLLIPFLAMLVPQNKVRPVLQIVSAYQSGPRLKLWQSTLQQIDKMLGDYMWAQFLLSVIALVVFLTVFTFFHVPFAAFLAVVGSVLELIPIVGPLITAILVMGTVLASGFSHWIGMLIFLVAFRIVQDYINTPLLMKAELEMPPLAVIMAVLIGGELGGGLGMFVSIPAAAAIKIAWQNWRQSRSGSRTGAADGKDLSENQSIAA